MLIRANINYRNTATVIFKPCSRSGVGTYGGPGMCDATITFSYDMRGELGPGYSNYTSDHFSNFTASYSVISSDSGRLYYEGLRGHTYHPETGYLDIYYYGHSGNIGYVTVANIYFNFTIICVE